MDFGVLFSTFVVIFREALEASLIVGIILTILVRMDQKKYFPHVFVSCGLAIVVSLLAGFIMMKLTESVQGDLSKIIEGVVSLLACAILTYMVFWMSKQARTIKSDIEEKYQGAIKNQDYWMIMTLPFVAILREGVETVLFLKAISMQSGQNVSILGFVAGVTLAVGLVLVIFVGGKKISLRPLFRFTGIFILFIAAGLLAYGIHELQEVNLIPEIVYPVWNINHILNEKQGIGAFLKAIFGYNGNPSLIEVSMYVIYFVGITYALNIQNKASQA